MRSDTNAVVLDATRPREIRWMVAGFRATKGFQPKLSCSGSVGE